MEVEKPANQGALQCGAHWPYYEPAASALRREMSEPLAVFNNCSGKHAGMLAAARALGAPLETYLEPTHPVQERIRGAIAEFTGAAADQVPSVASRATRVNSPGPLQETG